MRLNSRLLLAGIVTGTVITGCFFGARAELSLAQRSADHRTATQSLDMAEADLYCAQHQADGCWSPSQSGAEVTARN